MRRVGKWLSLTAALNEGSITKLVLGAFGLLVILIIAFVYLALRGGDIERLATLGYPGIFLIMFISGGSIFFPIPGMASVMAAGAVWNPLFVGMAGGAGNAFGELTGYAVGNASAALLGGRKAPAWWSWLRSWMDRYAFMVIVLMAMVPNPLFDAVGVLAGSFHYSMRRFFIACLIGNFLKYTAAAYFGDAARAWFAWGG